MKVHPAPDLSSFPRDASNRVRVIMTLHDPPFAAASYARRSGVATRAKLDFRSSFTRSYLDTLEAEQESAIARLHREIPQARVSRRYQVLENGFAVSVPYARLPELLSSGIATRVYPSLTYHLALNRGPAVIGAPQFSSATGAKGDGVKVAVVDDGVDHQHPFFDPKGFSYPPGFPKGTRGSTTPKGDRRRARSPAHARAPRRWIATSPSTAPSSRGSSRASPWTSRRDAQASASGPRAAATPRSPASPASRLARTSATTACSTCRTLHRSAGAARPTARRSSRPSRRR